MYEKLYNTVTEKKSKNAALKRDIYLELEMWQIQEIGFKQATLYTRKLGNCSHKKYKVKPLSDTRIMVNA